MKGLSEYIPKSVKRTARSLICSMKPGARKKNDFGSEAESVASLIPSHPPRESSLQVKHKSKDKRRGLRKKKHESPQPKPLYMRDTEDDPCGSADGSVYFLNTDTQRPTVSSYSTTVTIENTVPEQPSTVTPESENNDLVLALDLQESSPSQTGNQCDNQNISVRQRCQSEHSLANATVVHQCCTKTVAKDVKGNEFMKESHSTTTIYSPEHGKHLLSYSEFPPEPPASPDPPQSVTIVRVNDIFWDSKDGEHWFKELKPKDSLSVQHKQLTICKVNQTLWCTNEWRRFLEIEKPEFLPDAHPEIAEQQTINSSKTLSANFLSESIWSSTSSELTVVSEINDSTRRVSLQSESLKKIPSQNLVQQPSDGSTKTDECQRMKCTGGGNESLFNGDNFENEMDEPCAEHPDRESTPVESEDYQGIKKLTLDDTTVSNPEVQSKVCEDDLEKSAWPKNSVGKCYEISDILDKLAVSDDTSTIEEPADFASLLDNIALLIEENPDIPYPDYCPAPGDFHKLLLNGPGLKKLEGKIKQLEDQFTHYTITVSEPDAMSSDSLFGTNYLNDEPDMPCYLHMGEERGVSTVGVFVKDNKLRHSKRIMAVTAGHAIMNQREMVKLQVAQPPETQKEMTREVCEAVIGRNNLNKHLSVAHHDRPGTDVRDSPFIAFSERVPDVANGQRNLKPFQLFSSDIALLPVDPDDLDRGILSKEPLHSPLAVHTSSISLDQLDSLPKKTHIAGYLNICETDDITRLYNKRVRIVIGKDISGSMVHQPQTLPSSYARSTQMSAPGSNNRRTETNVLRARHIPFTTKDPLLPGCSGSPVMVYNKKDDELYIIGLLMGSFRGDSRWTEQTLYQAMPLAPALRLLEYVYPDHLENLEVVCSGETSNYSLQQILPDLAVGKSDNEASNALDTGFGEDSINSNL